MEELRPYDLSEATPTEGLLAERTGLERRRAPRPIFSDAAKTAARQRAGSKCECENPNCWHYKRCKASGVAYVLRRTTAEGEHLCSLFCRECAKTAARTGVRL